MNLLTHVLHLGGQVPFLALSRSNTRSPNPPQRWISTGRIWLEFRFLEALSQRAATEAIIWLVEKLAKHASNRHGQIFVPWKLNNQVVTLKFLNQKEDAGWGGAALL